MKSLMKNALALALAIVLVLSPMKAFAAELPTEAVYDMEKGGTQEFLIRDAEGNVGTVIIEEIEGNSRVADGNYRVSYDNTGVWEAGFFVSISDNKIYNAYSPFYYALAGEIRYPGLTRPSTTQAVLAFIYVRNLINYNTGVSAKITNSNLVVTKR